MRHCPYQQGLKEAASFPGNGALELRMGQLVSLSDLNCFTALLNFKQFQNTIHKTEHIVNFKLIPSKSLQVLRSGNRKEVRQEIQRDASIVLIPITIIPK